MAAAAANLHFVWRALLVACAVAQFLCTARICEHGEPRARLPAAWQKPLPGPAGRRLSEDRTPLVQRAAGPPAPPACRRTAGIVRQDGMAAEVAGRSYLGPRSCKGEAEADIHARSLFVIFYKALSDLRHSEHVALGLPLHWSSPHLRPAHDALTLVRRVIRILAEAVRRSYASKRRVSQT